MEQPFRQDPLGYQLSLTPASPIGTTGNEARGYQAIDDPAELRIVLRELRRVRTWIKQFADVAAEMPDYDAKSVQAINASAAVVTLLIERADARLYSLTGQPSAESGKEQGNERRKGAA